MAKDGEAKFFYGYVIVVAAFCGILMMWGTFYTFGVFLKPLSADLGWTRAVTSGAFSLYMVLHGLLAIGAGRLNDRFGPRLVIGGCGFFLGLGYLLMSQVSTIWHLYLFYGVIIAIGMSGSFVPFLSTVARWFVKRRGTMTGIVVAGIGVGIMIMSPLASWLTTTYGWRISYVVVAIIALVTITVAAQFLRREPAQMGLSAYGEDEVKAATLDVEARGFSLQAASRTKQFWLFCAMYFCLLFCINPALLHIVPHATDLEISATVAASFLTVIGGVSIAGKVIMGNAADRIGLRPAFIISFALMALSYSWLMVAKEVWMFYLFAVIFGLAYGGLSPLVSPMVAELFGLRSHGTIFGVALFVASIGGAIGSTFAGYIFDIRSSYDLAFLICATISIIAIILTLLLRTADKQGARA